MKDAVRHIAIDDYNYELPDERIARFPLAERDGSKLLIYSDGELSETVFRHLPERLPADTLLIFNNTKVIQARLLFRKETGARIEIFCLEPAEPADYAQMFQQTARCVWKCLVGNLKKWKGETLAKIVLFEGKEITFRAQLVGGEGTWQRVEFSWDGGATFAELLDRVGELPIPPYLNRPTEESDKRNYQTVYSKIKGSVAAPTAGLHFTPELLETLQSRGIETEELTLHVGAGTFQPVKSATLAGHAMHAETVEISLACLQHIRRKLGHIAAVGTTSVRTLESLYYIGWQLEQGEASFHVPQWLPYDTASKISVEQALDNIIAFLQENGRNQLHFSTQLMIAPAFPFRIVEAMITNFHQPRSTLLLLVSAFVGGDWKTIYDYALARDFRFLSYGDSSLLFPKKQEETYI